MAEVYVSKIKWRTAQIVQNKCIHSLGLYSKTLQTQGVYHLRKPWSLRQKCGSHWVFFEASFSTFLLPTPCTHFSGISLHVSKFSLLTRTPIRLQQGSLKQLYCNQITSLKAASLNTVTFGNMSVDALAHKWGKVQSIPKERRNKTLLAKKFYPSVTNLAVTERVNLCSKTEIS